MAMFQKMPVLYNVILIWPVQVGGGRVGRLVRNGSSCAETDNKPQRIIDCVPY